MNELIVDTELLAEFVRKSQDPLAELQFKGGVSYGTAYTFLKTKKAPRREKTLKRIATGCGVEVDELFRVSTQTAS